MILYLVSFLLVFILGVTLFINLHPAFGGSLTKEQIETYKHFDNYVKGKFVNTVPKNYKMSLPDSLKACSDISENNKERTPKDQIRINEIDWSMIKYKKDSLTWLGHSAFLISIDNKKILLDPMLGAKCLSRFICS
jgi:hypothetical protein